MTIQFRVDYAACKTVSFLTTVNRHHQAIRDEVCLERAFSRACIISLIISAVQTPPRTCFTIDFFPSGYYSSLTNQYLSRSVVSRPWRLLTRRVNPFSSS